jgi:hypothetical protein
MISRRTYLWIVLLLPVIAAGCPMLWDFHGFLHDCSAYDYSSDNYLAYCDSDHFGDYEHGAFFLETEPAALAAVKKANILFLGNSRMQFALSTNETEQMLSTRKDDPFYLLGFGFGESYLFPLAVMSKLHLAPKVLIVNIDDRFFLHDESPPAQLVTTLKGARSNYQSKILKQDLHEFLCGRNVVPCGEIGSIFRSRGNGFWITKHFHKPDVQKVTDSGAIDEAEVTRLEVGGRDFLNQISVPKSCIVFISSPLSVWSSASAAELARRLAVSYVAASDQDWNTMDGSHLIPESAERWSKQILEQINPVLDRCLVR